MSMAISMMIRRLTHYVWCLFGKHAWEPRDEPPLIRSYWGHLRFSDGTRYRPGKPFKCLVCGKTMWT